MEVLTLLDEARAAGLLVFADGDLLTIRGPKVAEPIVRKLMQRKPEVMRVLRGAELPDIEPADIVIRCPYLRPLVRGPEVDPSFVSCTAIPANCDQYHLDGSTWLPIPAHWRPNP